MGHPSSHAQKVLERLDAFLGEQDDREQMLTVDRVAMVAVVGNEDGAHHVGAELYQGLNDVGFSLAPGAMTYWVGEAMQGTDYRDLPGAPDAVATATAHDGHQRRPPRDDARRAPVSDARRLTGRVRTRSTTA